MAQFNNPFIQHFDDIGKVLSGGKLTFFEDGSTTVLKNTFTDAGLTVPNTNPVILSQSGREPPIFLDGTYRVTLQDRNNVQISERDSIT